MKDNIVIEDLDSNNFRENLVPEEEEKDDKDNESWVSATLSEPNNKS